MSKSTKSAGSESAASPESFTFQAEISQLLHILSHSLYQNREIAIRELISNASDAISRFRHLVLTNEAAGGDADELEINVEPDAKEKRLVIRDNGTGMTHDELVENLGTIAHSGSLKFIREAAKTKDSDKAVSLIGQFGVGFYSAFMLADTVEVWTRSFRDGEDTAWKWTSKGDGQFSVEALDQEIPRGTQVRLNLKHDLGEFADETRLRFILRKYSTFVPWPIRLAGEHVNNQRPIWVEPKSSLKDEQYAEFFAYLTHQPGQQPRWQLHLSADSPFQFNAILFCPQNNFEKLGFGRTEQGLHLCARRILVQNDNRDLLPEHFRFLVGVVDSEDLPLNVSRETLQDNTIFRKMQKVIVKKLIDFIEDMSKEDAPKYNAFYDEFGMVLREGVATDYENRERIAGLMRFRSVGGESPGSHVSLDSYIERAADDQKQIYFVSAPTLEAAKRDPNMEIFRKRDLEVLTLTDPADEFMLSNLGKYADHEIRSIDAADLNLPPAPEKTEDDSEKSESEASADVPGDERVAKIVELFKEALGDQVEDVRRSERLTTSACCLVNPRGSMSTSLQKVLQINTPDFEIGKLILEINPKEPLITRLCTLSANDQNHEFIKECGRQLYANAMVQAGLTPDTDAMAKRVQSFMKQLADERSGIAT